MDREKEKLDKEQHNSMVMHNTMLLAFEGWIKFIEGYARGLQSTKTVDAGEVFTCIGEIMEYMQTLRRDLLDILNHCETILEENENLKELNEKLTQQVELISKGLLLTQDDNTEEEGESDGNM